MFKQNKKQVHVFKYDNQGHWNNQLKWVKHVAARYTILTSSEKLLDETLIN